MSLSVTLASTVVVALAEIGDKTMLLAIVLAARLRKPWQILAGILAATLANHALASFVGTEVAGLIDAPWFRAAVAIGFIVMAAWTLIPDRLDDDEESFKNRGNAFLTTLVDDLLASEPDGSKGAAQPLEVQVSAERAIDTTRIRVRGVTPASAAGRGSHDWWRRKSAAEAAVADAGPLVTVAFPDRATAVLIVADNLPAARAEPAAA